MNKMMNEQRGVTFIGWCIILAIIGFFVLITLRLFPLYNEKITVLSAMNSVASRPGIQDKDNKEIFKEFLRTVQVGGSQLFDDTSIKTLGKIEKGEKGGNKKLHITFAMSSEF